MMTCVNCGAKIEEDVSRCPYCGFINKEGAEKKFRSEIREIEEDIREARQEGSKGLQKGLSGGARVILITAAVLAVLAVAILIELFRETRDKPKIFMTAKDHAYASAYKLKAGKELTEAYDDKDIERMAQIFDEAYSVERVSLWGIDHYETGYAASCYMKLKERLPALDSEKIGKHEAEEITYYCFYFYYRAYGEDGKEIFDSITDEEIIPIITERLGYSQEDMETFKDKVCVSDGVNRTAVYKATKRYYRNYH